MKVQFNGSEVEASGVEVLTADEKWSEYQLADGKVLRLKTVLLDVQRIEGMKNSDGSQVYQFQTHVVSKVS